MANDSTILIKNGTLVSSEYDSEKKDILIAGKKIKSIENSITAKEGWKVIDADKLMVTPGFLSIHSHDDFYLPLKEHPQLLKSLLYQGITTSISGNCGISNYPIDKSRLKELISYQGFIYYKKPEFNWSNVGEYLEYIKGKMVFNLIPLAGHGTIRVIKNGFKKELSTSTLDNMKKMLEECMNEGCLGMTSGLMYMPGTFSTTDELIEMVNVLSKYKNRIYTSHLRGYSDTFIESVNEAIKIGRETGVAVLCSHLGPFGVKFG
ncbi:MAG: N-acyl-D-amino-acid deacylase family protein, partial [Candidatus Humimicrobiaceae bacterium]